MVNRSRSLTFRAPVQASADQTPYEADAFLESQDFPPAMLTESLLHAARDPHDNNTFSTHVFVTDHALLKKSFKHVHELPVHH